MGNQSSHFLAEESQLLTSFSGETGWAYDDGEWLKLLNFKQSLNSSNLLPGILFRDLKGFFERLVANDRKSHNVATLMALVAVRLNRAWYFSSTDLELTTNAVVLLRAILRFFISQLTAAELSGHLGLHANPAKTRNPDLERVSGNFSGFVASLLDFLALSPLKDEAHWELHVQVLTLTLTLLSTQLVEPDVLAAASLLSGEPPLSSADPGLAATMALGSQPVGTLAGQQTTQQQAQQAASSSTSVPIPGVSAPTPSRAAVLIGALLRNIAADGGRDEDFEPCPPDSSSATQASKLVDTARGLAYKAAASTTNTASPLPPSVSASYEARAVAQWGSLGASSSIADDGGIMDSVINSIILPAVGISSAVGPGGDIPRPLAERSALLLLLLTHNCRSGLNNNSSSDSSTAATADAELATIARVVNPYRYVLTCMTDADDPASSAAITLSTASTPSAAASSGSKRAVEAAIPFPSGATSGLRVKFRGLFLALKNILSSPLGTVLFYTLMHGCPSFAEFTLSRSDVDDCVVVPLCKQLYYAGCLSPEHRYMMIIALLLLSQDASFCENAHRRIRVKGSAISSWFTERRLGSDISLGSLLVILLVRLITAPPSPPTTTTSTSSTSSTGTGNGSGSGSTSSVANDAYLHSNCLAVLANMSPHCTGLHVYAAQKLVAMLGVLHKRHSRAATRLRQAEAAFEAAQAQELASGDAIRSPVPAGSSRAELAVKVEMLQAEVARLDSAVRVCLEALHAAFHPGNLGSNLTLLYQLLHARATVLAPVANDPVFADDASGLAEVAAHFFDVLKREEEKRAAQAATQGSGGPAVLKEEQAAKEAAAAANPEAGAATEAVVAAGSTGFGTTVAWEEEDVERVLAAAVMSWSGPASQSAADAAAALREAKFAYEEDASPEVFFCPFLWSLTLQFTSDVGWAEYERDAAVPTRLIPLHPAVGLYPAVPLPATAGVLRNAKPAAAAGAAAASSKAAPSASAAAAAAINSTPVGATAGGAAAVAQPPLAAAV